MFGHGFNMAGRYLTRLEFKYIYYNKMDYILCRFEIYFIKLTKETNKKHIHQKILRDRFFIKEK